MKQKNNYCHEMAMAVLITMHFDIGIINNVKKFKQHFLFFFFIAHIFIIIFVIRYTCH